MPVAKATDAEFIAAWVRCGGSPAKVARLLGMADRTVFSRRSAIEASTGKPLPSSNQKHGGGRGDEHIIANSYLQRVPVDRFTGTMVVFSDCHYWPGEASLAHRALIEVLRETKPGLVIANGDVFDGSRLSRFPRNGWEEQPLVRDELDAVKERMDELRQAAGDARLLRTIGNHDIRFDRHLALHAAAFEETAGFRLSDHLLAWQECLSVFVNKHTMVKHRFHGGIHAAYNNTLRAGTNIVTGHTHYLEVRPWGDYRGRRYGVQTGALADVHGPQFSYGEDNATPHCSGFAVLTFDATGALMPPELCEVVAGRALFRGQVVVEAEKPKRRRAA